LHPDEKHIAKELAKKSDGKVREDDPSKPK